MATATSYISIEQYLRSEYEPDAEYVDGVIEERPVGELDHSVWQEAISAWFRAHRAEWKARGLPELRVQVAPTRFRIPDVTVLDWDQPHGQIITDRPLAVFEILSPEDTIKRSLRKLADYEAMDIAQIWLIDSDTKTYYQFKQAKLARATHFGEPGDRIHFVMSEIEALLD
jgi:Uma2 family endonuclease